MELFQRRATGREIGFGEGRGGRHQHQTDDGEKIERVHPRLLFSKGQKKLHCTDDWERRGNASKEGLRSGNKKAQPRAEAGSYSTESSNQFKYLDRLPNHPILLDLLPINQPAFLIE
jgi:hypothetical protein